MKTGAFQITIETEINFFLYLIYMKLFYSKMCSKHKNSFFTFHIMFFLLIYNVFYSVPFFICDVVCCLLVVFIHFLAKLSATRYFQGSVFLAHKKRKPKEYFLCKMISVKSIYVKRVCESRIFQVSWLREYRTFLCIYIEGHSVGKCSFRVLNQESLSVISSVHNFCLGK